MMTWNDLQKIPEQLHNINHRGGQPAVHRPLLMLLALGRLHKDDDSWIEFDWWCDRFNKLRLLTIPPTGNRRPESPFLALLKDLSGATERLWEIELNGVEWLPVDGAIPLSKKNLIEGKARGRFTEPVRALLEEDKRRIGILARIILKKHFQQYQDKQIAKILEAVGLSDFDTDGTTESLGHDRIASDLESPKRSDYVVSRIIRDSKLAKKVKKMYNHQCQICGRKLEMPDGSLYSEAHHLQPLGEPHNGKDTLENMICLCPNCHAICDLGGIRISLDDAIPELHTRKLCLKDKHRVKQKYIDYHNKLFRG